MSSANNNAESRAYFDVPAAKSQFADQKKIADKINQDSSANNVLPKPDLNKLQPNTHNNLLNEPTSEADDWKPIPFQAGEDPDPEIRHRRDTIREMMQHAWNGYVNYAWGHNELNPISATGHSAGIFGNTKIGLLVVCLIGCAQSNRQLPSFVMQVRA